MSHLPTGTVTFLFTDIEGSTQLWEQHPQAMEVALAQHHVLLRQAIAAHAGVVFQIIGDAFCAAFPTAPAALHAALLAQCALRDAAWGPTGPIRVRMAVHTATVAVQAGDYPSGPHFNRLARLLNAGHGSQILLTRTTQELVRDDLPPDVELRDLGMHRLKDLTRPEQVFQVVTPDLPATFPVLNTLDARSHNLPVQPTSLIGREAEVAQVCDLLRRADVRLVTLTGPGGVGKTRLALQVAAELLDAFADGVWFVNLAPITEPAFLATIIAQTLGVRSSSGWPLLDRLKDYLREKQVLLLVDNFEQIVDAAPMVGELLATAPGLKVLVTSRMPLHLSGEREFAVPPLALPDRTQPAELEGLSQYEAVRLFIDRAQAVKPDFTVTNRTAPAVAEICYRLDGLPLAIELAAARAKLFPPEALLARLSSRLKFLTSMVRDLPERQHTIRNTIDWSYELLDKNEKTLFTRLGVFVGDCTLEAAEAVCNADGDLPMEVVDGMAALVDQSLLRQKEGADSEPRFTMLETIREYAMERLKLSEEMSVIRDRHATYYVEFTEEAESKLHGQSQKVWLDRLGCENDNLRAALEWLSEQERSEAGLRLAGALWQYWVSRGSLDEGRKWLGRLLTQGGHNNALAAVLAKALHAAGVLARYQGDQDQATSLYQESLSLRRELGDKQNIAWSLTHIGNIARDQGNLGQASSLYEESLALFREAEDKSAIAILLQHLGRVAHMSQAYEKATMLLKEALVLSREQEDTRTTGLILRELAEVARKQRNTMLAMTLLEESVDLFRNTWDKLGIAWSLTRFANVAQDRGEYAQARALYKESLTLFQEMGIKDGFISGLVGFAKIATEQVQTQRAARLLGVAEALCESSPDILTPDLRAVLDQDIAAVRAQLGETVWAVAWAEGQAMTMNQAVAYALDDGT